MSKDDIYKAFSELKNVSLNTDGKKKINSFSLRTNPISKRLTDGVLKYYKNFAVSIADIKEKIDLSSFFKNKNNPLVVEIGFGDGKGFIYTAENNIGINYIGFDVYLEGFSECLTNIGDKNLTNAKVIRADFMNIAPLIKKKSLDGINIFFPDPWPKNRHHKRRLINDNSVKLMALLLKKGCYIHFATDYKDYAYSALEVFNDCSLLKNKYNGFAPTSEGRPHSSYEQKAMGNKIYDIVVNA